jgi:hypothetical protein
VPARVIGQTGGAMLRIAVAGRPAIDIAVDAAERIWASAIPSHFSRRAA